MVHLWLDKHPRVFGHNGGGEDEVSQEVLGWHADSRTRAGRQQRGAGGYCSLKNSNLSRVAITDDLKPQLPYPGVT